MTDANFAQYNTLPGAQQLPSQTIFAVGAANLRIAWLHRKHGVSLFNQHP
jgi:hypothetical protein